jgi:hypothetical protein
MMRTLNRKKSLKRQFLHQHNKRFSTCSIKTPKVLVRQRFFFNFSWNKEGGRIEKTFLAIFQLLQNTGLFREEGGTIKNSFFSDFPTAGKTWSSIGIPKKLTLP